MRIPMFGFALLAFLFLALILAVAVFFAFRSGEQGKTKLGGCAGCAIALGLVCVAGLGAFGFSIVALANLKSEWIRHGPVKSAEFEWRDTLEDSRSEPEGRTAAPLHLRLELRGEVDSREFLKWLRQGTDEGTLLAVHEEQHSDGTTVTVVELSLPTSEHARAELARVRRDLERALPDLRLPTGGKVVFKDPDE